MKKKRIDKSILGDDYILKNVEVPPNATKSSFWTKVVKYEFVYALIGLSIGLICIIGGAFLFLIGISGNLNLKLEIFGMKGNLSNAMPGAVLFLIGLFVIGITKFTVKIKNNKKK
jgi:hypothetical protein